MLHAIRVFTVTTIRRSTTWFHIGHIPWFVAEHAQEGVLIQRARTTHRSAARSHNHNRPNSARGARSSLEKLPSRHKNHTPTSLSFPAIIVCYPLPITIVQATRSNQYRGDYDAKDNSGTVTRSFGLMTACTKGCTKTDANKPPAENKDAAHGQVEQNKPPVPPQNNVEGKTVSEDKQNLMNTWKLQPGDKLFAEFDTNMGKFQS